LLNPIDLINARCTICSTTPEVRNSKHLFIDLPKLTEDLEGWVKESSANGFWSANSIQVTNAWLK